MCHNYHGYVEQSCSEQPSQTKIYIKHSVTACFVELCYVPEMHKKETVTNNGVLNMIIFSCVF